MIYNFDKLTFLPIGVGHYLHRDGTVDVAARTYGALSLRTVGEGDFLINGKRFLTQPGDVLYIPENTPYRVTYRASESIVAHFEDCNYTETESITPKNTPAIEGLFCKLLSEWNARHSVNLTKSLVYAILEEIDADRKSPVSDAAFEACLSYLHTHFADPLLDSEQIAAQGFISLSGLQRKFHAHFAMSPKQYLTKLRMNRALELLIADTLSVREIALMCGFTDEKYFSRAFRNHFGKPPSRMRKNMSV